MRACPSSSSTTRVIAACATLFLATCLSPLQATAQELENEFVTRRSFAWTPLTGSVGSTSHLVLGEFHGDGIMDGALIADGRIVQTTPHYRTAEPLGPGLSLVTDLEVLRASSENFVDRLFCASSDGLVRWHFDNGDWVSAVLPGAWSAVDQVFVRHIEGTGVARLVVFDRTAASFYSVFLTRNDGVILSAAETASVGLSGIDDFTLLDWDDDGADEILVAHSGGLSSVELDGTDLQSLGNTRVHALQPLEPDSQGHARVALLMPQLLHPQREWLVVLRSNGTTEVPIDLGPWNGAGSWSNAELVRGDYGDDGSTDLAISERGGATLWLNTGSDQAFDGSFADLTPEEAPSGYVPSIALDELEGELVDLNLGSVPDLDALLAFPGHTVDATLFLQVGTTSYDQGARLVAVAPHGPAGQSSGRSESRSVSGPEPTTDSANPFGVEMTWTIPPAVPEGVEFEVVRWVQPGIDAPLNTISPDSTEFMSITVGGGDTVDLTFEFDWEGEDDQVIYYLETRLRLGARSTLAKLVAVAPSELSWDHYESVMIPASPGSFGPTIGDFTVAGSAKLRPGGSGPIDDWDPGVIFGSGAVSTVP